MATRQTPKPKPKPTTKYSWIMGPKRHVYCFKSPNGDQTVSKLWEVGGFTDFHDAELGQATNEINAILSKLEKSNRDAERTLSFIQFQNRHLLVWARYGVVGPDDDEATIVRALKLKLK
jgi:hypothetical protein